MLRLHCRPHRSSSPLFFRFLSTTTSSEPVRLDYSSVIPVNKNKTDNALVILHGLLGSKRNWTSLSKAFSKDLNIPVYALDLRNHGTSPHSKPMNYTTMADDVSHFFEQHGLNEVSLIGHSMGGKVAMTVALSDPTRLRRLIVADIAPAKGNIGEEFQGYIKAMQKIEESKVKTRKQAAEVLAQWEKDPAMQAFFLTNLDVPPSSAPPQTSAKFRIPLDIIADAIPSIGDFPHEPDSARWDGDTLFIKGEKSAYLNRHNIPLAKKFFPNMKLQMLDTGHWVHSERSNEFKKLVVDFITSS